MRELCAAWAVWLCLGGAAGAADVPSAKAIVAAADRVRFPDRAFRGEAVVIDYRDGAPQDKKVFAVYSKPDPATGQYRDVLVYTAPPRDVGKIVLLNGSDMWFYDPASKESIRIAPQQKLIGQASAGDVLVENLAADYSATITGSETIEDGERTKRRCWHLELRAATAAATYDRIAYWVEQGTDHPIKAKFYTDSGRLLKILYYRHYKALGGAMRPSQAVIIDAVDPTRVTTDDFGTIAFRDIPDAWFQRDYLPHLTLP